MKLKYILDYFKATSPRFSSSDSRGLYIESRLDANQFLDNYDNLQALQFNFKKLDFQVKNFDTETFLESWLQVKTIEYCDIKGGDILKTLPEIITKNPIKYFFVQTNNLLDLSNLLPKLTQLEELLVDTNEQNLVLGKDLFKTLNPKKVHIRAKQVENLDEIWNFKNLEYLHLEIDDFIRIPEGLKNLRNLKYLHIESSSLDKIDIEYNLPLLKNLCIRTKEGFVNLPVSLFSESLETITLKSNNLEFITQLPEKLNLGKLTSLELSGFSLDCFPELFVPQLKKMTLGIKASKVFSKIKQTDLLSELEITEELDDDISDFNSNTILSYYGQVFHKKEYMDFSVWKNLKKLFIKGSEGKKIKISNNENLKDLRIFHDRALTSLPDLPKSLDEIIIQNAKKLTDIEINTDLPYLSHITLNNCPNLKRIECNNKNLESLRGIVITQCAQLDQMCLPLLLAPNLRYCRLENNNPEFYDTQFNSNISKLVQLFERLKLDESQKKTLCFWVFKMHRFQEISDQIIQNTLGLLRYSHDGIFNLITSYFNKLSKDAKNITDYALEDLKDKKIIILGNPHETKTQIKQKAKDLGLIITTKPEQANFILLAKKAELTNIYNAYLITENDLQTKHDSHFTKILRAESTPQQIKDKLRLMLWSIDPATELTVLEMMKKQGMPQNVIGECIAIAKTSADSSVKLKYKQFLRPLLKGEELRLLIKNIRFEKIKTNPFDKLRDFPEELLGKFATALYKRTAKYWEELLNYNLTDKELRIETINDKIIPEVEKRPHYVRISNFLFNSEVDYILDQPVFTKKLNRLFINIKDKELPKSLIKHAYIKELEINGNLQSRKLPDVLFELKRLKLLKINSSKLNEVDDRILELTKLEKFFVYNEVPLNLSSRITELKKLTNHYIAVRADKF